MSERRHGSWIVGFVLLAGLVARTGDAAAGDELLAYGDGGLRLGEAVLHAKAVEAAAYDPAQDLVWFKAGGTLQVIDLRDPARKPITVAARMPEGGFAITGLSKVAWSTTYSSLYPVISLGKKITIDTGLGAYAGRYEDQEPHTRKAIKKIKITGARWLATQRGRRPRTVVAAPRVGAYGDNRIKLPDGTGECGDVDIACGTAVTFGDTKHLLVVVESSCGDACHQSCALYDPKRKRFTHPLALNGGWSATPPDAAGPCTDDDYGMRAGGEYYSGSFRCAVTTVVRCTENPGWTYAGWVPVATAATR